MKLAISPTITAEMGVVAVSSEKYAEQLSMFFVTDTSPMACSQTHHISFKKVFARKLVVCCPFSKSEATIVPHHPSTVFLIKIKQNEEMSDGGETVLQ